MHAAASTPLRLDDLAHFHEIEAALRQIFNCYVKGNIAAAEMVSLFSTSYL